MKRLRHVLTLAVILLFGLAGMCEAGSYYGTGYRHYGLRHHHYDRHDRFSSWSGYRSRHYDSDRLWAYLGIGLLSGLVIGSIVSAAPPERTISHHEPWQAPVRYRSPRVVVQTPPAAVWREVHAPVETVLDRVQTTPSQLNMRAIPEAGAKVIGRLERGTTVDVIGAAPEWLYVKTEHGDYGWIMQRYTRPSDAPAG